MANCMKVMRVFCYLSRLKPGPIASKWRKNGTKGSVIIGGLFGMPKPSKSTREELSKLEEPDPSKLSREYLIKSSSIKTAEEVGTLLLQTSLALEQAEKEYSEAVFALVVLMEYKLKVLDNPTEEERIWDLILHGRELVNRKKEKKRTLEMIFINSKNMLSSAAEVAYMSGAEFAGDLAGDRVYKIEQHLKQVQQETEDIEIQLRKAEAKTIEIEADHNANKSSDSSETFTQCEDEKTNTETKSDLKETNDVVEDKSLHENKINQELKNLLDLEKALNMQGELSVEQELDNVIDVEKIMNLQDDDEDTIKDTSEKFVGKSKTVDDEIKDTISDQDEREHENLKF